MNPLHIPVSLRTRMSIVGGLFALYCVAFVLIFPLSGVNGAALSLIPLGIAGWLFGRRGGVIAFAIMFLINLVLFTYVGLSWRDFYIQWAGTLLTLLVPLGSGWLSEIVKISRQRAQDLADEREHLHAEIEHRKQVEIDLERARKDAETANRAKSTFLATMSHELRTPLNAILGYSDLICEQPPTDPLGDYFDDLNHIHSAGSHLLGLINNILDLSKIEAGKIELQYETVYVDELVFELTMFMRPHIQTHHNTLEFHVADDFEPFYSDGIRLKQILLNILQNAAKFTANGQINVWIERDSVLNMITFRISDTGIGMNAEQLSKVFEPFVQADSSTTRRFGGTGLGLAIAQQLAHLLNGDITVESHIDHGTTFHVHLPIEPTARH